MALNRVMLVLVLLVSFASVGFGARPTPESETKINPQVGFPWIPHFGFPTFPLPPLPRFPTLPPLPPFPTLPPLPPFPTLPPLPPFPSFPPLPPFPSLPPWLRRPSPPSPSTPATPSPPSSTPATPSPPQSGGPPPGSGVPPFLPPQIQHCWSSLQGIHSCVPQIIGSFLTGHVDISTSCCAALNSMDSDCFSQMFGFLNDPFYPPLIKQHCSGGGTAPPTTPSHA